MKFSVIIPLYNKAPYVRKALESVLAQTYADYELIITDDGSTDESASIVEDLLASPKSSPKGKDLNTEENFPSLPGGVGGRLIRQANAGVSAARNNGVAQASGDYIAFLDADDWWEPTYLERMAQLIEDYPEAGLYACNYVYYKPGKTHVALNIPTGYINYPKAYYESGAMPVWTGATMMPREVFEEMGGFPMGIKLGEDFLLWAKIAMQYKMAFLNEALAWYNNDVPATLRATRNLHAPEHHMLFNLGLLGDEAMRREAIGEYWKMLIDKLRVNSLLDYWLDERYHDRAVEELKKVDWGKQPESVKKIYKTPIWILKTKRWVMRVGSFVKQMIIKLRK